MKQTHELPTAFAVNLPLLGSEASGLTFETHAVYVVYTTPEETMATVRVAAAFAAGVGVPVSVIHFREVPYAQPVDAPAGISPIETAEFTECLRTAAVDVTDRVFLCRDARQAVGRALTRRTLVFLGQRRRWRREPSRRLRRALERAGHLVVAVDPSVIKEPVHA